MAHLRPLHLPPSLTVGLIGFGRIGRRVAQMLKGVGFDLFLVADPIPADLNGDLADLNVKFVKLPDVLSTADVVSLHAPPEARGHLLGSQELTLLKEGSVLVNTARGALVDTAALIRGLAQGRPAMAALDVFEHEPPDVTVFEGLGDRLILTPHMSWYTEESELALRRQGAAEALRILQSQPPLHAVVTPAGRGVS